MNTLHRKTLTPYAQKLRREMTKAEKHLWYDFLKKIPFTVHRQKVIGPYIADFYIAEAKLIIELDGSQRYEEEHQENDYFRDAFMYDRDLRILRFPNSSIWNNFSGVCQVIADYLPEDDESK